MRRGLAEVKAFKEPLSSELDRYKTVMSRFQTWISGETYEVIPFSLESLGWNPRDREIETEGETETH